MSEVIVLNKSMPTARKQHVCSCCYRIIAKGETYENQRNVFVGRVYTYKLCAHCKALTRRVLELDEYDYWEEGITFDYLYETLHESYKTMADLRAFVWFRRRWTRRDGSVVPVPYAGTPDQPNGSAS